MAIINNQIQEWVYVYKEACDLKLLKVYSVRLLFAFLLVIKGIDLVQATNKK